MPAGLIKDENGVGAWRDQGRDFIQMPLHCLGVAARQHQAGANTTRRTDGAEDVGRFGALILGSCRPGSALGPTPRELGLLADPGFIGPPDLYAGCDREPGTDLFQRGRETFLKSSMTSSFWA